MQQYQKDHPRKVFITYLLTTTDTDTDATATTAAATATALPSTGTVTGGRLDREVVRTHISAPLTDTGTDTDHRPPTTGTGTGTGTGSSSSQHPGNVQTDPEYQVLVCGSDGFCAAAAGLLAGTGVAKGCIFVF